VSFRVFGLVARLLMSGWMDGCETGQSCLVGGRVPLRGARKEPIL